MHICAVCPPLVVRPTRVILGPQAAPGARRRGAASVDRETNCSPLGEQSVRGNCEPVGALPEVSGHPAGLASRSPAARPQRRLSRRQASKMTRAAMANIRPQVARNVTSTLTSPPRDECWAHRTTPARSCDGRRVDTPQRRWRRAARSTRAPCDPTRTPDRPPSDAASRRARRGPAPPDHDAGCGRRRCRRRAGRRQQRRRGDRPASDVRRPPTSPAPRAVAGIDHDRAHVRSQPCAHPLRQPPHTRLGLVPLEVNQSVGATTSDQRRLTRVARVTRV